MHNYPQVFKPVDMVLFNIAYEMYKMWQLFSSTYDPIYRDQYYNQFRGLENQFITLANQIS